jgi:L-lysine 2,3-aminomutase
MLIERLGGKCHHCGIAPGAEWPVACFDFHHKDRDSKTMLFAKKLANNTQIEELIKEADGCMVLCATCHRREHAIASAERIAKRVKDHVY